jgi:hypothetical protein
VTCLQYRLFSVIRRQVTGTELSAVTLPARTGAGGRTLHLRRDAKIDWKALSQRIGHADVAFTMRQYVQTDLDADRQVDGQMPSLAL